MASGWFPCCGPPPGRESDGELDYTPETKETGTGVDPVEPPPRDLKLEIHDATLHRSFARVGWMSPYAIVTADGEPVTQTKPSSNGSSGKSPVWEAAHSFTHGSIPHFITIAVWDKNNFHKDVFCGAVTIPCSPCMGALEHKDFALTKKNNQTGFVRISLHAIGENNQEPAPSNDMKVMRNNSIGGELDHIYSYFLEPKKSRNLGDEPTVSVSLREVDHPKHDDKHFEEERKDSSAAKRPPPATSGPAPPLMGSWRCVDTHGLDEFLKATGVGIFQRKLANAAAWPSWEFHTQGDQIHFINHSAIGDLIEDFPLNKDYAWKDGHKNDLTCRAEWTTTPEGGSLKIKRKGAIGDYSEERTVKGDRLEFVLTHGTGVQWGRSFERQ